MKKHFKGVQRSSKKTFCPWIVTSPEEKSQWENGICICPGLNLIKLFGAYLGQVKLIELGA